MMQKNNEEIYKALKEEERTLSENHLFIRHSLTIYSYQGFQIN